LKIILSPTKTQKISSVNKEWSTPFFIDEAKNIHSTIEVLGKASFQKILGISNKLMDSTWELVEKWRKFPSSNEGSLAIYTFCGEAFNSLNPQTLSSDDIEYSNNHLRIFSGQYGILKPLDLMMPYRLDVIDKLQVDDLNLKKFWSEKLTNYINNEFLSGDILINLSSAEYFNLLNRECISGRIITPEFKTLKNGVLKTEAMWSKRARGLLARKIIEKRVKTTEEFEKIKLENYTLEEIHNDKYLYIKR